MVKTIELCRRRILCNLPHWARLHATGTSHTANLPFRRCLHPMVRLVIPEGAGEDGAVITASWQLQVFLAYGKVYLESAANDPDEPVEVLNRAFDTGTAQGRHHLTVFLRPHCDLWPMKVDVEVWDAAPPDDLTDWPEAFEATLTPGADGLVWSSPTTPAEVIPVPPGTYRARITGRDFLRTSWNQADAHDNYRLQLWPTTKQCNPAGSTLGPTIEVRMRRRCPAERTHCRAAIPRPPTATSSRTSETDGLRCKCP